MCRAQQQGSAAASARAKIHPPAPRSPPSPLPWASHRGRILPLARCSARDRTGIPVCRRVWGRDNRDGRDKGTKDGALGAPGGSRQPAGLPQNTPGGEPRPGEPKPMAARPRPGISRPSPTPLTQHLARRPRSSESPAAAFPPGLPLILLGPGTSSCPGRQHRVGAGARSRPGCSPPQKQPQTAPIASPAPALCLGSGTAAPRVDVGHHQWGIKKTPTTPKGYLGTPMGCLTRCPATRAPKSRAPRARVHPSSLWGERGPHRATQSPGAVSEDTRAAKAGRAARGGPGSGEDARRIPRLPGGSVTQRRAARPQNPAARPQKTCRTPRPGSAAKRPKGCGVVTGG